ncbi:hypothetical protein KI387_035611, partial [Taxus chinensis]
RHAPTRTGPSRTRSCATTTQAHDRPPPPRNGTGPTVSLDTHQHGKRSAPHAQRHTRAGTHWPRQFVPGSSGQSGAKGT